MRQLAFAALTLLLATTAGCKSKQTANAGGGATDTSVTTAAPAPEPAASTAPRDFSFDQRQQFTESVRQQLATSDQQIKELAGQVKSKGGAVSDRALANIRASRKTVDRNLKRADAATAASWDQLKSAVNQSVDRLGESIEAAQPK
jgi:small-conductance mechanosensitive channel